MSTGSASNNGNVNITITATDAASAVFAKFSKVAVEGVDSAIRSMATTLGAAEPQIEAATGTLGVFKDLFDAIKTDSLTPLSLLKIGIEGVAVAWKYAAAQEEEAAKALAKYNGVLNNLLPHIKQVEDLQFENSLFGKGDFDKAMARKKRELDAVDTSKMTPDEKELFNQNKRITLEQYGEQLRRRDYDESQAKLKADADLQMQRAFDAVRELSLAAREEAANVGKNPMEVALAQLDKVFMSHATDKMGGDQVRNLGMAYSIERENMRLDLELKAAKEAELSYVRMMNQLEVGDKLDRLREQRLNRGEVKSPKGQPGIGDSSRTNLWETGFLTRAGSETYDPAMATRREQLAELKEIKRQNAQVATALESINRAIAGVRPNVQVVRV